MSSTEPRLPLLPLDAARAAAATVGIGRTVARMNVFRVWLTHPDLARWLHDLIMGLLERGKLDARLRELVIMRLGWTTGSVYEWTHHWNLSTGVFGLDPDDVVATRAWKDNERLGPAERAVLAATDDMVAGGAIGAEAWAACVKHVSDDPQVLLELVAAIACWRMVSTILRSLEIPLEDDIAPWPPDGQGPSRPDDNCQR